MYQSVLLIQPAKIVELLVNPYCKLSKVVCNTGNETGFYLPEVTHPEAVFTRNGFSVNYVSPKRGKAPMVGVDITDPVNKAFLDNPEKIAQVENTLAPHQVNPADYDAIFGSRWTWYNVGLF